MTKRVQNSEKSAVEKLVEAGKILKMDVTVLVSFDQISSLLCSAFEGGSNYWYLIDSYHAPGIYHFRSSVEQIYPYLDYPLNHGGFVMIETLEKDEIEGKTTWRLDQTAIEEGLKVMSKDFPKHFADILTENADAETGDVFLQCCLFGELVYG